MDHKEKLAAVRAEMKKQNLDGFLVPHADEYQSEYLPACAERLEWLTGFTGSTGNAVILMDKAMTITGGIYDIQMRAEVDKSLYEVLVPEKKRLMSAMGEWLANNAVEGAVIGFDPRLWTRNQVAKIAEQTEGKKIGFMPVEVNPLDVVWADRPEPPMGVVEIFPDEIAGATSLEKRAALAKKLKEEKIASVVITQSDSICWLLNVRGSDIPFNPLVLSNLILHADGCVDWYVDARKITDDVEKTLGTDIRIKAPDQFEQDLKSLKGAVMIDPTRSSMVAETILRENNAEIVEGKDPCVLPKSIKTPEEQLSIKQVHIRDGIAVSRFLRWIDCTDFKRFAYSEMDLADKLEEFRKCDPTYREPSFDTISGWASNGAIIHYHAKPETNKRITGDNLYLVDSGGQYEYGTTDITRTVVIGDITAEQKDRFTRVLKGHIAVASKVMDDTTTGDELDMLARASLKEAGLDYAHGTGHGVGCMLAVHEEAPYISPGTTEEYYKPGMLLSNEPGYYLENGYGIRHENLILCREREDGKLVWETVTLVPFDLRGVNWEMMEDHEIEWLKTYHTTIFEVLRPFLASEELDWLHEACFSYFEGGYIDGHFEPKPVGNLPE